MAKRRKGVNRRRKKNDEMPIENMNEFAQSTAKLVIQMCKVAGESGNTDIAFNAFRNEINEVLDEHQRDLLESLFYESHKDLENIRGSEKSGSNDSPEDDSATPEAPEPVPKETIKVAKEEQKSPPPPDFHGTSLLGLGVGSKDAPSKFKIDDCLVNYAGTYVSKKEISEKTGVNYDSVRKRITEIKRMAPHDTTPTQIMEDPYKETSFKLGNTGTGLTLYLNSKLAADKRTELVSLATSTSDYILPS